MIKQERLLAKYGLFQQDTREEQYLKMKEDFVFLLNRTVDRCTKFCENRNSQERYASMCDEAVPGLIERRKLIDDSVSKVNDELKIIDALKSVDEKIAALKSYATGLANLEFNALFMVILSGELKKRWVPMIEAPSLSFN